MENKRIDQLKKFVQHYENVDRAYGKHPVYKFNETIFVFGEEKDILKENPAAWMGYDVPRYLREYVAGEGYKETAKDNLHLYLHEIDGIEYMSFHFSWYESLKSVINDMCVIDSEEVFYNFYQK